MISFLKWVDIADDDQSHYYFHFLEELIFFEFSVWSWAGLRHLVGRGGCVSGRWADYMVGHVFMLLRFDDWNMCGGDFDEPMGVQRVGPTVRLALDC